MKKRFMILILALFIICSLAACDADTEQQVLSYIASQAAEAPETPDSSPLFNMELIGKDLDTNMYYYRHAGTDVIYLQHREKLMNAGIGGLTAMLDPETGLPLTYSRYMEIAGQLTN